MAEYIERGGRYFPTPFSAEERGDYRQGWNHCLRAIYQQPVADVEKRKTGKWAKQQKDFDLCGVEYFACSQCGFECQLAYNFCPNCGAVMKEEIDA